MSALPLKADIKRGGSHVRFVPKADKCAAANDDLFDHLVGEQLDRVRDLNAERPRCSQVMTYSNLVVCNTGTDRSSPALDPSAGLPLIATVMVRRASYTSATECSLSLLRLNNLAVKMPSGMAQYWQDRGEANQKENCADSQQRNNDKTPDRHHQRIGYDGSNRGFDRPCGAHLFVQEHRKGNHRNRQRHHGEVEPDEGAIYDQRAAPPGCQHLVHKVRDRNRRICSE